MFQQRPSKKKKKKKKNGRSATKTADHQKSRTLEISGIFDD